MKTVSLMITTLQAARLMQYEPTNCATKIEFDGHSLTYSEIDVTFTDSTGEAKLAQNPSDKTWIFVKGDENPIVSFDQADCVEDNTSWLQLNMDLFSYESIDIDVKQL